MNNWQCSENCSIGSHVIYNLEKLVWDLKISGVIREKQLTEGRYWGGAGNGGVYSTGFTVLTNYRTIQIVSSLQFLAQLQTSFDITQYPLSI